MKKTLIIFLLTIGLNALTLTNTTLASELKEEKTNSFGEQIIDIADEATNLHEVKKIVENMNVEDVKVTETVQDDMLVETLTVTKFVYDMKVTQYYDINAPVEMVTYSVSQTYPINGIDSGARVRTYIATWYESKYANNLTGVRITGCEYRATTIDSAWRLISIKGRVGQYGGGHYANGTPGYQGSVTRDFTWNPAVNGRTYATPLTGTTIFVIPKAGTAGSNMTVNVRRTDGTNYSFYTEANLR